MKKIKSTREEDSLDGMLLGSYLDGQMEIMIESTGKGWIRDGENGKGCDP